MENLSKSFAGFSLTISTLRTAEQHEMARKKLAKLTERMIKENVKQIRRKQGQIMTFKTQIKTSLQVIFCKNKLELEL